MNCRECGGEIETDKTKRITLQVGCESIAPAYRCGKCGRLHWPNGAVVKNRGGQKVYRHDLDGIKVV